MPCHSFAGIMLCKKKEPSLDIRHKTIDRHKAGSSYCEISLRLDLLRSTVLYVIDKFAKFGTAETFLGRDGSKNY